MGTKRDDTGNDLAREAAAARDLIAQLCDDPELVHDMVEGETGLLEAIDRALDEIDECGLIVAGCRAKEEEFAARRANAERREERLRGLIEQALVVADLPTVKRPSGTLTVRHVPPKPVIVDEALIPAEFWKQADPRLDRAAIARAVKDGANIPGVAPSNGTTSLIIRRK